MIALSTSQNSPFSTVKVFFVIPKKGYFTGKKCDKIIFSEFLGYFLLHSCYLDLKKKNFRKPQFPFKLVWF